MALVKVEFCEKTLGETVKLECSPDKPAEFNFNAVVTVTFDDTCNLDEIAYRQVLCEYNQYKPLCCMNAPVYSRSKALSTLLCTGTSQISILQVPLLKFCLKKRNRRKKRLLYSDNALLIYCRFSKVILWRKT